MLSHADLRWQRRDIKTSSLLGHVLAKNAVDRSGNHEALLIDQDGRLNAILSRSEAQPDLIPQIDTFEDIDRGYAPRNVRIDRLGNAGFRIANGLVCR